MFKKRKEKNHTNTHGYQQYPCDQVNLFPQFWQCTFLKIHRDEAHNRCSMWQKLTAKEDKNMGRN